MTGFVLPRLASLSGSAAQSRARASFKGLLFGVSRLDPFAFGAGAVLLLAVATVACVVPMGHATAVDPVIAVRAE
jgi:putative ABC transport system permease protein